MSGVRYNGFLASTAVALLLTAGGGAFAQTATAPDAGTAAAAAGSTKPAAAGAADTVKAGAKENAANNEAETPTTPAPATASAPAAAPGAAEFTDDVPDAKPAAAAATTKTESAPAAAGAASVAPAAPSAASPEHAEAPAVPSAASPEHAETPAASATKPVGEANAPAAATPSAPAQTGTITPSQAAPANANPATAASAAPSPTIDDEISLQLHQLDSSKFDRLLGGRNERQAIAAFYSGRSYAPLWISDGHANARAKAASAYLAHVGADGLDPADYPVPDFNKLTDPAALAQAELRFSMSVIRYAHHASIGRVAWSRVDANIWYDRKAPEPASVLAAMAGASDVGAALDAYEPHTAGYVALKKKLAEIRAGNEAGVKSPIPHGPTLRVGSKDKRVAALRERLGVSDPHGIYDIYDKTLAEAVKKFQKAHGIRANGMLTAATLDAINGPRPAHVIDTILANMERWRWMPHHLGNIYVMINLPDFTASVYHDGKRIWKTKIVIGKVDMPTPIMTAEMKFITVNPTWHVPPSIINREYLPAMAQDPTVMQRMGLVVERDSSGRVTGIYQPPGDKNAEGRLRFNFPNKFLVYQHDTPDKYMFAYARRAFSHGCMRTQDPAKYAEVLLSLVRPHDGYTVERIERMYGPNEVNIEFPTAIPVDVTYQTAFVDSAGKLEFRDDIYGRDRELLAILNGPERRVADIPVEHHISAIHRAIVATPQDMSAYQSAGGGGPGAGAGASGGGLGGLFARLFGGAQAPQPAYGPGSRNRNRYVRSNGPYDER
jgi:L,D-transpeptidase YcbB